MGQKRPQNPPLIQVAAGFKLGALVFLFASTPAQAHFVNAPPAANPPHSGCPANGGLARPLYEQMTHFVNHTGVGYGYSVATTSASGNFTIAGVPGGASIVRSYLWTVNQPACMGSPTLNGSPMASTLAVGNGDYHNQHTHPDPAYGSNLFNDWIKPYCANRSDVPGGVVTGNGSYALAGGGSEVNTLLVIWQNPADTLLTTIAVADGLYVWHPDDGTNHYGQPPIDVNFNWDCEGNPICSTPNVRFTRVGDRPCVGCGVDQFNDQFEDPVTGALRWASPPTRLQFDGDIDEYTSGGSPGAFVAGQSSARWGFGNALQAPKGDYLVTQLILSNTCTMPTPTPSPSVTNSPTPFVPVCPPGSLSNFVYDDYGKISNAICIQILASSPTPSRTLTLTVTRTQTRTPTPTVSMTATPTATPTVTVTVTLTRTPTVTRTVSLTPTPSITVTATPTRTVTPTVSVTPTPTVTVTRTATPTLTPTVSLTRTPTPTPTNTVTVTVTRTASPSPTPSVTVTATPTRTVTPTVSVTPTPTVTVTRTATPSPTPTVSATPTPTITLTRTPTVSVTPTVSATPTPTVTVTRSQTPSVTYTVTVTATPTATVTRTATPSLTPTVSATPTPTATLTRTPTRSVTMTVSQTATPTFTPSYTATLSSTVTVTITVSPTVTVTRSITPGPSPTFTPTFTMTPTATATRTETLTSTFTQTVTFTRTHTPTFTATPTFTPSTSNTFTATYTPTYTATLTSTLSSTLTSTPSISPTPSQTSTISPGPSPTFTLTSTVTATHTPTFTMTHTRTPTATVTHTRSHTPTFTQSMTRTHTPTETPTRTITRTSTESPAATPTWTPTWTPTYTATPTFTVTPTATPSSTETATRTWTPTATQSITWTHTPTLTHTRTVTPTATQSITWTHTPTLTHTRTATGTATRSVTWTHTPTATPTFTPSRTSTRSVTWTHTPTVTLTSTYTATPSSTSTDTPTATATDSPTVTSSYTNSPTATDTPTTTPTPIPEPYQVSLRLYNSAGELVRAFYTGTSQVAPTSLTLSMLALADRHIPIEVLVEGLATVNVPPPLLWHGDNDNGQAVDNGMYYFKLEASDAFGQVTSFTQSVSVMGNLGGNSLEVYNPAGELVHSINLTGLPSDLSDFAIVGGVEGGVFAAGLDPATGLSQGALKLGMLDERGNWHPYEWNGLNDLGTPVQSGNYILKLVRNQLAARTVIKTAPITVLNLGSSPAQDSAASAVLGPNPLAGAAALAPDAAIYISFKPTMQGAAGAGVYNVAGELISQAWVSGSSGQLKVMVNGLAAGIYAVDFQIRSGAAILGRKAIKFVIIK